MIRRFFCVLRVIFSTSWTKLFCIRFCYDGVSERDLHKFIKEGRRRHTGSSSVSPYTGIHPSHLCVKFIATNVVHCNEPHLKCLTKVKISVNFF